MLRRDLCDHAGEFSLEIDVVKLGQHQYAPEAVRQFVAEFPFGVGDRPSAVLCHGEFYEVADIADEPRHDFIARPGAPAGGEGGGVETGPQGHSLIGECVEAQGIGWLHEGRGEIKTEKNARNQRTELGDVAGEFFEGASRVSLNKLARSLTPDYAVTA